MGLLDDLLEVGTCLDWVSPVLSIAGDIANGGGTTLMVPADCGWTGGEVVELLRANQIRTWGHMIVKGVFMITVPPAQAHHARYLLRQAGLPTGAEPTAPAPRQPARPRPRVGRSRLWQLLERG